MRWGGVQLPSGICGLRLLLPEKFIGGANQDETGNYGAFEEVRRRLLDANCVERRKLRDFGGAKVKLDTMSRVALYRWRRDFYFSRYIADFDRAD